MTSMLERGAVLGVIEDAISPYIGKLMAQASIQLHCRQLELSAPTLTPEQVEALLDRLAKALRVLIGSDKTAELVRSIEATLALKGGAP